MMFSKLRIERKKHFITQSKLALKVGISRQSISAFENNKCIPSILLALKIAKSLNKQVKDIFILEDSDT
jgi:putative transcriptional regulator